MKLKKTIPALPVKNIKQHVNTIQASLVLQSGIRKKHLLLPFGMKLKYIFGRLVIGLGNGEVYFYS